MHLIRFLLVLFNDLRVVEHDLEVCNAGLQNRLIVFRLVIFAVFGEVAEGKRHLDFLRHFLAADDLQVIELLFKRLTAFFCDIVCLFSHSLATTFIGYSV